MVPKEIVLGFNYELKIIPFIVDDAPIPKNLEFLLCNVQSKSELDELVEALEMIYEGRDDEKQRYIPENVKKPVVIPQRSSSSLYKIETLLQEKIHDVYVPPITYMDMEKLFIKSNLLYLHNTHNVGKYTTAIALLNKAGVDEVFEWSKEMSLKEILSHPIKRETGFIIEIESINEFLKLCRTTRLNDILKNYWNIRRILF
ncbi:hypothetical protein ACI2OX_04710 [Bacillus sp. N9]